MRARRLHYAHTVRIVQAATCITLTENCRYHTHRTRNACPPQTIAICGRSIGARCELIAARRVRGSMRRTNPRKRVTPVHQPMPIGFVNRCVKLGIHGPSNGRWDTGCSRGYNVIGDGIRKARRERIARLTKRSRRCGARAGASWRGHGKRSRKSTPKGCEPMVRKIRITSRGRADNACTPGITA